jgi:hypothetical protein
MSLPAFPTAKNVTAFMSALLSSNKTSWRLGLCHQLSQVKAGQDLQALQVPYQIQGLFDFCASHSVHFHSFLPSFALFTDLEISPSILELNTFNMRLAIHSLLALATVLPTLAFTNGSLIPSYFCNPKPDGLPKSLGELIPFTIKDQCTDLAFNNNGTYSVHHELHCLIVQLLPTSTLSR